MKHRLPFFSSAHFLGCQWSYPVRFWHSSSNAATSPFNIRELDTTWSKMYLVCDIVGLLHDWASRPDSAGNLACEGTHCEGQSHGGNLWTRFFQYIAKKWTMSVPYHTIREVSINSTRWVDFIWLWQLLDVVVATDYKCMTLEKCRQTHRSGILIKKRFMVIAVGHEAWLLK